MKIAIRTLSWMASLWIVSAGCLVILATGSASYGQESKGKLDVDSELKILEDFREASKSEAVRPMLALTQKFRDELAAYSKELQASGNLDGVLSVKGTIDALDSGGALPPSKDPKVSSLQNTFLTARATGLAQQQKAVQKSNEEYLAAMKQFVEKLTQSGNIEAAIIVRDTAAKYSESIRSPGSGSGSGESSGDMEVWKKKAIEEFPALSDPQSKLSLMVKQRAKDLKYLNSAYFNNPQWPYLLAKECNGKIVEGVKESRFTGVYVDPDGNVVYGLMIDDSGALAGFQYSPSYKTLSFISGRQTGEKLVAKWTNQRSGSINDFSYLYLDETKIQMDGKYVEGGKETIHKRAIKRIVDPDDYDSALNNADALAVKDELKLVIKRLKEVKEKVCK